MKRYATALFLILLVATCLVAQDQAVPEEEQVPVPVKVNVLVKDESGQPLSGIMVQAQKVGRARQALTDKEGRCTLNLMSGEWVVKAIRLGAGNQLLRLELTLAAEEIVELPLVISYGDTAIPSGEPTPQTTDEISATSMDPESVKALVQLDEFTDIVLKESLKKIVGNLAVNRFTTSYWVENKDQLSNEVVGFDEPVTSFRLDNDWSGNVMNPAGSGSRKSAVENMFSGDSVLSDVPVNVKFGITPSTASQYDFNASRNTTTGFTQSERPTTESFGLSSFLRMPGRMANMLTGGSARPGENLGYELGDTNRQFTGNIRGFFSYYNEINSSIANLYRPLRDRYTDQAVSSSQTVRAIEFGVEKTFLGGLRATVFYSYSESSGLDIRTVDLHFEDWQDFESFLQNGIRHDLSTNLEARIGATGTSLSVGYKVYINDIERVSPRYTLSDADSDFTRLDLRLQQNVELGILSSAKVSFNIAINNLLNNTLNTYISPTDLDEEVASSQRVLGGIKIEF